MKLGGSMIQRAHIKLNNMENCVFCKIIKGDIPCYKIYEDDKVLSFLDIKPVHPGHALVIPKTHVATLEEINSEDLSALILIVKQVGQTLKEKLNIAGYNLILNNNPVAGQEIPHLHFHLVPRHLEDGLKLFPHQVYKEGEAAEVLKKLLS